MASRAVRICVLVGLTALTLGLVGWWLAAPVHEASTLLGFEGLVAGNSEAAELTLFEFFQTQKVIAESHTVCLAAADALLGRLSTQRAAPGKDRQALAEEIRSQVAIRRVSGSQVLGVTFKHADIEFARTVSSAVANAYLKRVERLRLESSAAPRDGELGIVEVKVARAEDALNSFARAQQTPLSVEYLAAANAELVEYNQALASAKIRVIELAAELNQLEQGLAKGNLQLARFQRDPAFGVLVARLTQLRVERANAAARTDSASVLAPLDQQLEALRRELLSQAREIVDVQKAELQLAREKQRQVAAEAERVKLQITETERQRLEFARLQRRLDAQHKLFEAQTGQSVESVRASLAWKVRIVDHASSTRRWPPLWSVFASAVGLLVTSAALVAAWRKRG